MWRVGGKVDAVLSDDELVAAARGGDAMYFGLLLERHRAGMYAVALAVLGWRPDAEDAVQDAMVAALSRLNQLRDPAAAGPWLRAIARNQARMRLRSQLREPRVGLPSEDLPSGEATPEELLEDRALRDWLCSALAGLSEPLQLAVLLRYFTGVTSYAEIAAVCGVPIGTVRSRLNDARRQLTNALCSTADTTHDDSGALTARRRREAQELLSSAPQGGFRAALASAAVPDLVFLGPQGQRAHGQDTLLRIMESDLDAGVGQHLVNVAAGHRVTILECDLLSPLNHPDHCPPGVIWVMTLHDDRINKIRLFHPLPTVAPATHLVDQNGEATAASGARIAATESAALTGSA